MEKSASVRCKRIMVNLWMTVIFVTMAVLLSACSAKRQQGDVTDYSDEENWAYFGVGVEKAADLIFYIDRLKTISYTMANDC